MAPSKTYNLPGLACAYAIISNSKLRYQFQKVARGIITEVNVMGCIACVKSFSFNTQLQLRLILGCVVVEVGFRQIFIVTFVFSM